MEVYFPKQQPDLTWLKSFAVMHGIKVTTESALWAYLTSITCCPSPCWLTSALASWRGLRDIESMARFPIADGSQSNNDAGAFELPVMAPITQDSRHVLAQAISPTA